MRAFARDRDVLDILQDIQPQLVAAYLRNHGWSERERIDGKAIIWSKRVTSGKPVEVFLPLDRGPRDYLLRMSQALYNLAMVEQRSELAILQDIAALPTATIVEAV